MISKTKTHLIYNTVVIYLNSFLKIKQIDIFTDYWHIKFILFKSSNTSNNLK
jgi:hypothetical protein